MDPIKHTHAGNDHDHDHDHHHGLLSHNHAANAPHKILITAICLTLLFAFVEAIAGLWSHSLALLGDAGHMGSDALALAISAFATWMVLKPPSSKHSYGLGRAEVIAAWVSSLLMIIISVVVIVEAVERIHHPAFVNGKVVVAVAFAGILINGLIAWMLARGERTLNIRAALLHVMGDLLGSIAALIAGAVIYRTHWYPIDPILSILIAVLILFSSFRLLRESLLILMEGVPGHIDYNEIAERLNALPDVKGVHDLHIWNLSSGVIALSAHVHIHELSSWDKVLTELLVFLKAEYAIEHVTLQPEPDIIDCQPCLGPV